MGGRANKKNRQGYMKKLSDDDKMFILQLLCGTLNIAVAMAAKPWIAWMDWLAAGWIFSSAFDFKKTVKRLHRERQILISTGEQLQAQLQVAIKDFPEHMKIAVQICKDPRLN